MEKELRNLYKKLGLRYQSHPWHGINIGKKSPEEVMSFIEMTPSDSVKYEIDKESGYIKVDRPQKFSNIVPALYGFLPQTYCAESVAEYCMEQTGKTDLLGDNDPLDICVLTERNITHGNIIVPAIPIGGFRMIDDGEADDKIIAVLKGDEVYEKWQSIEDCPEAIVKRLKHYFLTYKGIPGEVAPKVEITHVYGKEEALEVIKRSRQDYITHFGEIEEELSKATLDLMSLKE
ncbi:MAG: inorganic pyrophosphatase [Flavobacteriales bacterium]|nr:inorganic pyrophosphatase [Flavobacteriales bacterium]